MEVFFKMPVEMEKIIELLIKKEWLISGFEIEEIEHYIPENYLHNFYFHNSKYIVLLDSNIFSYIIKSYNYKNPKPIHREAIALVAFCQFAEINLDISIPIYEYIKFDKKKQKEAYEKMELFFRIDDTTSPETLIDYALEKRDDYIINEAKDVSRNTKEMYKWFDKYDALIEWDSMYLIVMKITDLNLLTLTNEKKFEMFMEWQNSEFRYSMIGIAYSIIMFSALRKKGMMKYNPTSSPEDKRRDINNMTWDFYFMIQFYRRLEKKENNEELLLATDDKVIKFVLKILIDVNNSGKIETLAKYLSEKDCKMIDVYKKSFESNFERKFKDGSFLEDNHRNKLIEELETKLYQ